MAGRWWPALVATLVAVGLLAWWSPPPGELLDAARGASVGTWLIAASGLLASYLLRAVRLRDEWAQRFVLRWTEALHVVLLHSMAVNLLPMRAGEAGYPWLLQRHWGIGLRESAASLLWLRLQDVVVLAAMAFVMFAPFGTWQVRIAIALVALLVIALPGRTLATAWRDRLAPSTGFGSGALHELLAALQRGSGRGWLWTGLHWTSKVGGSAALVAAVSGIDLPPALAGALLGEVGAALPLHTPAGLGAYEAGVWAGAGLVGGGVPGPSLIGAALIAHVFALLVGAAAALVSHWARALRTASPTREQAR